MVLRTLSVGRANGYEIARAIERMSDDVLAVDHGSLYRKRLVVERSNWEQMAAAVSRVMRSV